MTDKKFALQFTLDGSTYQLSPDDFTGADDLAIYQACGVTLMDVFGRRAFTVFTVAALVWRYRVNHGEPNLTYEQVNGRMTIADVVTAPVEDAPAPEA